MTPSLMALIAAAAGGAGAIGLLVAVAAWAGWLEPAAPRRRGRGERKLRALAGVDGGAGRAAWWAGRRTRVLTGSLVLVVVWLATGWPMAGLLSGIAAANISWLFNPGREHAEKINRLEGLEEWVRRMSDIHTVGLSLEGAVIRSVATVPDSIAAPVRLLAGRLGAGWPPDGAYRAFADDLDDVTADMIVALMLLHVQDRGAGLGKALKDLSTSVAEEVLMRRKVEADRAKPRANMRWITVFCLVVFGLSTFSGAYTRPYSSVGGQLAMIAFAVVFVLLLVWMRRMANLRPVPRFLSRADRTLSPAERAHAADERTGRSRK
ncbi:type II secretion system F family protein [Streptacidiphilus rugosus]|uniref:type II secretion system F family protein n=1 Tax=Streptacidiphilus rugosus TaxID=405783 RepID=UPI001E495FBA|nr:secretion system protein [Streptacidiphilus rugosus]